MRRGRPVCAAAAAALALAVPGGRAAAQDSGVFRAPSEAALPDSIFRDARLDEILVTGAAPRQEAAARAAMAVRPGDAVDWIALQAGLEAVRALPGIASARFVLERSSNPTTTRLVLEVEESRAAPEARFPNLLLTDRARVTLILNGAVGGYSDTFPWFGDAAAFNGSSPLATSPPEGRRASWGELSVEAGAGGIGQLGSAPLYAYGAATALLSAAAGQDLFTDESRALVRVEKAYVGLLWANRARRRAVNLSAGRQNFNLGDGFLVSQFSGSANAGPRPGLYLNPRIAFDMAAVLDVKLDTVRLKAFYLNPDELERFESRTEFAGLSASWMPGARLRLGATSIWIPQSGALFRQPGGVTLPREGVHTLAFDARLDDPLGAEGVWLQSEVARQRNAGRMRAWAAYGTLGYRFARDGWKPALSYRFSAFSGDDPATPTFERYDPLLSGGLGEWVQGVSFKKLVGNSNMNVHRLRATASPSAKLNLTVDLFDFEARELNNLGGNPALGTLSSHDIGREVTVRADWFAMRRLYVLFVASHAVPGRAIRAAALNADARPWTTLQASAFWNF